MTTASHWRTPARRLGIAGGAVFMMLAALVLVPGTALAQGEEDTPRRGSRGDAGPGVECAPGALGCSYPLPLPGRPLMELDAEPRRDSKKRRRRARPGVDYIPREKSGAGDGPERRRSSAPSPDHGKDAKRKKAAKAEPGTKAGGGDVARVRLRYAEKELPDTSPIPGDKTSSSCEGGSLVAGVNCVTKMIEGAGGGAGGGEAIEREEKSIKARLNVAVRPELVSIDDGRAYKVTLDVGAPKMNVPQALKPQSRLQALSDVAIVMARLRQWSRTLNAKETEELKSQGYITRPLVTPFRGLKKMRLAGPVNLTVRLREEEMEIRLRFVRAVEGGFAAIDGKLRFGQQFFIEARFKTAPEESEKTVRLFYDDLPGTRIKVARTADDDKLYRSKGYHLMYGYDDQP